MSFVFKVMEMRHVASLPTTSETVPGTGGRSWDGSYDPPSQREVPMDPMTLAKVVKIFTDLNHAAEHEAKLTADELARSMQSKTRVNVSYFTQVERVE